MAPSAPKNIGQEKDGSQGQPYVAILCVLSRTEFLDPRLDSLPSATKLRRLCFHRSVSVHGGCVPGPGGCLLPGGVCSIKRVSAPGGVYLVPGGCLLPGASGLGVSALGGYPSMHLGRHFP